MNWQNLLKKEKYMPFLPIIKAEKNLFRVGNLEFTQILDMTMPETQKHYNQWKRQTQGLRNEAIGVKGKASKAMGGKKYNDSLFEHIFDHVIVPVQRPKQPVREGAEQLMTLLENVIEDDDTPITDEDADDINELVEHIRKMGEPKSDLNPANIPFTQPRELVEPKREGEKWGKKGSERIYGHYRTPMYQEMRQKVYGEKSPPKAGKAGWYSKTQDGSARPPFWQGLFAQSSVSAEAGGELTRGLLGILEELEKGLAGAKLGNFTIIDKRRADDKKFINGLVASQELIERLEAALKNPNMYGGNRKIIGMRLLAEINDKPYKDKNWIDNDLGLQQLIMGADLSDMPIGWKKLKEYNLKLTAASIDNVINQEIRGKNMMAPNGRPYILPTDGTGKKLRRYPWHSQYQAANKPVKKSWIDMLWR